MPGTTGDELRDLLNQQVQIVSEEALRSDGQVSPQKVENVQRLAHLVDLYQAAQAPRRRRRWPVLVALGITLLIVSLLFFARVAETEIELDLALSEVSFALPTQQVLANIINLSALGVSGMREIKLPWAPDKIAPASQAADGAAPSLLLSVATDGKRQGSISLATLAFPAATHVWLLQTGTPQQYRLSLKGSDLKLRADVYGPVQVGLSGTANEQLNFVTPKAVLLQSGTDEVDLDLTFPDSGMRAFSSQLSASDISFSHIDEFLDTDKSVIRRVSTVLSGTLYFASLNDSERKLRPGEMLDFEKCNGEFRTLRFQDGHIDAKFHGRVRGMTIGSEGNQSSLMPTWLEWLQARHGLSLLWGAALYVFGLVAGILRWWGKPL